MLINNPKGSKMLWTLLVLQGIFGILPTEAAEDIVIQKCDLGPGVNAFTLCWDDSGTNTYNGATLTVLKGGSPVVINLQAESVAIPCVTFNYNLNLATDDSVDFLLNLNVDNIRQGVGKIHFAVPATVTCNSVDKVGTTGLFLRFSCSRALSSNDVISASDTETLKCTYTSKGTISYCLLSNSSSNTDSLTMCETVTAIVNDGNPGVVAVCSAFGAAKDAPVDQLNIDTAQLDYMPAHTVTTLPVVIGSSTKFELVNYWSANGDNLSSVCTGTTLNQHRISCDTNMYARGTNLMNFVVVGYDSAFPGTLLESTDHFIQDYNFNGEFLFSTTMEVVWTPEPGVTRYWLSMTCVPGVSVGPTMTDCPSDSAPCYGYFLDVTANQCYPAIQPDIGNEPDPTNKIITSISKFAQEENNRDELNILGAGVIWNKHDLEATTRVCFNHTIYKVDTSFSHYEFVMINKQGKWLKHKLVSHETDGELCFTPFVVDTEDFDVTETVTVVVTQRDTDGVTVLASGITYINF